MNGAGNLSGFGWAENFGWINFDFNTSAMNRIQTDWRCDPPPPPPPAGMPQLMVETAPPAPGGTITDASLLSWVAAAGGTGNDVISGDLVLLHATGGDFRQATTACIRDNTAINNLLSNDALNPGEAIWYGVRDVNCAAAGTYDTGGSGQAATRDAAIAASGNDCP